MDLKKIGAFLKELRKDSGLTQEQLGEQIGVSGRTVSRWETGANLPDLDVLVVISDFYGVELRELLDGERRLSPTDSSENDTALKVVDYSKIEKQNLGRRIFYLLSVALLFFTAYIGVEAFLGGQSGESESIFDAISGFCLGFAYGAMIVAVLVSSRLLFRPNAFMKKFLTRKSRNLNA